MKKYLLLWDIDGTLIKGSGVGVRAILLAMKRLYGIDVSLDGYDYRGRTDILIAQWLLPQHGIEATNENITAYLNAYLNALEELLAPTERNHMPGIVEILELAHQRPDIVQALLTGNLERGAFIKLKHHQIDHYFKFGAYSDDSHIRNELGPIALKRAKEKLDAEFLPENVYIIGDTPHDIACGKVIGAKTIAVATGGFSKEQLASHEPTAVFENLSDATRFFELLEA